MKIKLRATTWLAKNLLYLITFVILLLDFNGCKKEDVEPSPPVIDSFSPVSGQVGASVTISGKNFGQHIDEVNVLFGSVQSTVSAITSTAITTVVPAGATTGKISVSVNGLTTVSAVDFTVEPAASPIISSFSPSAGKTGASVVINGDNFGAQISANVVKFNGTTAVVSAASKTQLTVTVPEGATTGKITISVNGATATSVDDFIVTADPTITSFSPAGGNGPHTGVDATIVTISGANFGSTIDDNIVKFNNVLAVVTAATPTQITTSVPTGASTGKITVTVNAVTATSQNDFVVYLPPTITSFSPTSGNGPHPGVDATTVTINGTNFNTVAANNVVKFNGTSTTAITATSTQLTAAVPVGATTGKLTIEVNGFSVVSSADFVVNQPPAVTSFTPLYGLEGTTVTISGTGFSDVLAENLVFFNGTAATISGATSTQLTVEVPTGSSTGTVEVRRNGLSGESVNNFEVLIDYPRSGLTKFYPFNNSLNESLNGVFNFSCDAVFVQDRFARAQQAMTLGSAVCGIPGTVIQDAPWTISMWGKYSGITGNKGLFSSMQSAVGLELYLAEKGGGYAVEGFGRNGVSSPYVYIALESTPYLTDSSNGWMNFTMTYDGSVVKTYINGVLKDSENVAAGSYGISTQFLLGYALGERFAGELDDLLIYNRVLSGSEIQQLQVQTATKYPGL